MKRNLTFLLAFAAILVLGAGTARGQAIKVNIPTTLVGTPNVGYEQTISQQFSLNADILWAPYMFKKHEEVLRSLIVTGEMRFYVNPKYYYTNNLYDGFYVGPYAMWGNFNIGFKKSDENKQSWRYRGWGVSGGATIGYKFFLSERFRLDLNLGVGYLHYQYDQYKLGGEHEFPSKLKETGWWIGPTKFGVHLVYNLFR